MYGLLHSGIELVLHPGLPGLDLLFLDPVAGGKGRSRSAYHVPPEHPTR